MILMELNLIWYLDSIVALGWNWLFYFLKLLTSQQWDSAGSWNPSSYRVNILAAGGLVMQGAMASMARVIASKVSAASELIQVE